MKQFGFTLTSIIVIGALGYGGYVAITSLKDPKLYVPDTYEKIGDLHRVATSTDDSEDRSMYEQEPILVDKTPAAPVETVAVASDLETQINALITQKVILKKGSKGAAVKSVQEFMNQYFKITTKVDGDFGNTLEANVKKFQTANKISATGQVASKTLQAMADWLAK